MNNRTNPWYTPPGPDYPCAACNMPFALANPERGKVCHQCKKAGRTPEKCELPINPTPCPSCAALRAELESTEDNRMAIYGSLSKAYAENATLRAALAERDAKIRELDARIAGIIEAERKGRGDSQYRGGLIAAYAHERRLLRELGLIVEVE